MRATTSDGQFGFVIERTQGAKLFVFQLIIEGVQIGDREPCILGTAVHQLRHLTSLSDNLGPTTRANGFAVLAELEGRDDWHDATLVPLAESLDGWQIRAFIAGLDVIFFARPNQKPDNNGSVKIAIVPYFNYESLLAKVVDYWTNES